jgi:TPR repeat protein
MYNIIEFPLNRSMRLEKAIKAFEAGDGSRYLAEEFRSLSKSGFPEASIYLGYLYEDGSNNLPRDVSLAFEHYEWAASEIGFVEAYMAQARILYHGKGDIDKDIQSAKEMYELIVNETQNPIACFMLGRIYQNGEGIDKNLDEAERLYNMAIEKGNVWGMLYLAELYAEKKMYFSNLKIRIRAVIQAFKISRKNPNDTRLRRI